MRGGGSQRGPSPPKTPPTVLVTLLKGPIRIRHSWPGERYKGEVMNSGLAWWWSVVSQEKEKLSHFWRGKKVVYLLAGIKAGLHCTSSVFFSVYFCSDTVQ